MARTWGLFYNLTHEEGFPPSQVSLAKGEAGKHQFCSEQSFAYLVHFPMDVMLLSFILLSPCCSQ